MLYKNVKVDDICPVVYIKDKATEDWKENERYVLNKVVKLGLSNFGVENPIDDLVYIQFDNKDWTIETQLLSEIYKKLSKTFDEVKINLHLDDFIDGIGNSVDLTLDEYLSIQNIEKVWEDFWKEIVCNEDGSVNVEQIKKELYDFNFILDQVPKVYCHITNGLLSKPNYKAETVINEFESCQSELINKEMAKEDLLEMLEGEISEETKKEIEKYFS